MSLERLMFGRPLSGRDHDADSAADCAALNEMLGKVTQYLNDEFPAKAEGRRHAVYEIDLIRQIPHHFHAALVCKRMAVGLFFMRENVAAIRMFGSTAQDRHVIVNLGQRFYPLLLPHHVQHLGQRPDRFARACSVLWGCWRCSEDVAVVNVT